MKFLFTWQIQNTMNSISNDLLNGLLWNNLMGFEKSQYVIEYGTIFINMLKVENTFYDFHCDNFFFKNSIVFNPFVNSWKVLTFSTHFERVINWICIVN